MPATPLPLTSPSGATKTADLAKGEGIKVAATTGTRGQSHSKSKYIIKLLTCLDLQREALNLHSSGWLRELDSIARFLRTGHSPIKRLLLSPRSATRVLIGQKTIEVEAPNPTFTLWLKCAQTLMSLLSTTGQRTSRVAMTSSSIIANQTTQAARATSV